MQFKLVVYTTVFAIFMTGCGENTSPASTADTVKQAASGDKQSMRDLEKMVREKARADKISHQNLIGSEKKANAFYFDLAAGKIDDNDLRELVSVDENIHAQVYVARTIGKRDGLAGADQKLFAQWLEHISTVDTTHMYYALNDGVYPLAGEAAFIISEDYLNAKWLYATDTQKAVEWLKKAANSGQPEAMYKLATRYQYGLSVDENVDVAKAWLTKSADAGWRDATSALAKLGK